MGFWRVGCKVYKADADYVTSLRQTLTRIADMRQRQRSLSTSRTIVTSSNACRESSVANVCMCAKLQTQQCLLVAQFGLEQAA